MMEYSDRVSSMDYLSKPERSLVDKKARARPSMNLQDKFKEEKPSVAYSDFHRDVTKKISKNVSHQFAADPQKQRIGVNEVDEDELVKYMSNLPSYLHKGEAIKEKALNVGVLDWRLLEKWQCHQKQMPYRINGYSPSSSNTSSSFSTDESSTHSSRGHSCSPISQRIRRPSLQSHLSSSLVEAPSQGADFPGEDPIKLQALKNTQSVSLNREEIIIDTASPLSKKHLNEKSEQSKVNVSIPNRETISESGNLRNDSRSEETTFKGTKGVTETRAVEDGIRVENVQKPNSEHNCSSGNKRIILLLPKGDPESGNLLGPQNSNMATQKSKVCQRSYTGECKKASNAEMRSKKRQVEEQLSSRGTDCPSKSASQTLIVKSSPSRGISETKKENPPTVSSTSIEHSKASETKPKKAAAEKVRSLSPFYRFTSGASKMSKSSSLNDSSGTRNQRSADISASRPSTGDKPSASGRARSSPLRRLLDPILKSKAENGRHSEEPPERVSGPADKACNRPADEQNASFATRSGKVKLGMTGCKKINVNELAMGKKIGPSTVQALLRVAVKNGLPLYTFAVSNESNILAASVKTLGTKKNACSDRVYTFFTIQDVKKKTGSWISQGGRVKGQDYVSNVVAQMKVSDCGYSDLSTQNIGVRDFVLFSVGQAPEFQPKDELAAILVKYPKRSTSPSSAKEKPIDSTSWIKSEERLTDSVSTTVIFPSAVHSLPRKGGPSSLIERWISGGSCDCGGWDLGCKLRILANPERSNLSKAGQITGDRFELFPRGGLQENRQVFSLTPFKEGIYSVEFHSSISVLQAFSICTSVLDTKKQTDISEPSREVEQRNFDEQVSTQGEGSRYVSYPPHSPVGRV